MSTYTPSTDDIITPGAPRKKGNPIWAVIVTLLILFCCCCLCSSILVLWIIRFGISFITGLFGGF